MKKLNLKTVAVLALLTAAEIVFSRFLSISLWNVKFGFSFLIVAFAAREFGPAGGAAVGGLGDLVGALLFPIGPYFPGFTLSAALCGAVFGVALRKGGALRITLALCVNNLLFGTVVNSFWISLLYGAPFLGLLPIRLLQAGIMIVIGIPAIYFMNRYVPKIR